MTQQELDELFTYFSSDYILIINKYNRLQKLLCPFKVRARYDIGNFKKGEITTVDKIKFASNQKRVFIIQQKAYYLTHWEIL